MAPPENGEDGSMASTPTRPPPLAPRSMSRAVRVDLPVARGAGDADDLVYRRAGGEGEPADLAGCSPPRSTSERSRPSAALSPAWAASSSSRGPAGRGPA